jgi:hypothetical protein
MEDNNLLNQAASSRVYDSYSKQRGLQGGQICTGGMVKSNPGYKKRGQKRFAKSLWPLVKNKIRKKG